MIQIEQLRYSTTDRNFYFDSAVIKSQKETFWKQQTNKKRTVFLVHSIMVENSSSVGRLKAPFFRGAADETRTKTEREEDTHTY